MAGQSQSSGGRGRVGRKGNPLALLLAAGWLALLLVLAAGAVQIAAASPNAINPLDCATGTPTPCPTTPADTPTNTPAAPTATPTVAASATDTPTSVATDTPTATATDTGGGDQGGGGVVTGGDQSGGAQPTKVVLAQPTVGAGGDSPLQGLTPAAFSSNGLLIATSLSCVVSILGLIVAVVAMSVLVKGGYGPFLKVLVLGKRAARWRGGKDEGTGAAHGDGWDQSGSWGSSGAYEYDYDASARYSAQPARTPSRNGSVNGGNAGDGSGTRNGNSSGGNGGPGRYDGPRSGPRSGSPSRQAAARTRNLRER